LWPQHCARLFDNTAHEWAPPPLIAIALATPLTTTGVDEPVVVPFPSCPDSLAPQHLAVPLPKTAHECAAPVVMPTAFVNPLTTTGVDESTVLSFPN
jgi:hypothetical protein